MKILIVTETFLPAIDGIVTRLLKGIDYMKECGHEVIICAPKMDDMPSEYNGFEIVPFKSVTFPFYKQRPWGIPSIEIKHFLEKEMPDVVHSVMPVSLAASGAYHANKLGIPLVCSFHTNIPVYLDYYHLNVFEPIIWKYFEFLFSMSKVNLVTSKAMYDDLSSNGIKNISILPKGVDLENRNSRFYDDDFKRSLISNEDCKKLLIFIGRLAPEKEIDSLVPLLKSRKDLNLAIVGDGPDKERLEKLYSNLPVKFTGFLKGEELSKAFASADAFIFPSTSETLGLVITEAMASGLPVIAAKSAPTDEQIIQDENGFVYETGNFDDLISQINKLYDNELISKVKFNGLEYSKKSSWEDASKDLVIHYERAIQLSKVIV